MRSLVYGLMTVSVLAIVTVLILIILGYSFNRQDGRLEQGGLLQFASTPSGAAVTVDGIQTSSRTPSKVNIEAKSHHVQMTLAGYRPWQKTIAVQAGGNGWLSYTRLVPMDIKTETMRTFSSLAASKESNDRKWILAQETVLSSAFTLINIESDAPRFSTISIPESVVTKASTQSFTIYSWSDNSDRFLVKHTFDDGKIEWISVDRQNPTESINITTMFGIAAQTLVYGERNGSSLYALTDDGVVRKLDTGNQSLSGPLVENVAEFSIYGTDTVVFVSKPDSGNEQSIYAGYRAQNMSTPQTIYTYPEGSTGVHIALGEYYGKRYVTSTHNTTLSVHVGTLPRDDTDAKLDLVESVVLPEAAKRLTLGKNGRLAVAEMTNAYTTYDIELDKHDTTTFTRPATIDRPLQWIDSYIITSDRANTIRFYEFDGANQQDIMPAIEGQAISLTGNEKYLYGFTATEDGSALTRARMIVAN